jgi:hypothetical protein
LRKLAPPWPSTIWRCWVTIIFESRYLLTSTSSFTFLHHPFRLLTSLLIYELRLRSNKLLLPNVPFTMMVLTSFR